MSDDLRTRIAKVLYEDWWHGSWSFNEPPRWEKLSDAARDGWLRKGDVVIRELDSHGWLIDPESSSAERAVGRWPK